MRRAALWLMSACLLPLLLAGCAMPRMIDSDVNSFAGTAPAVRGASFRFDRLPSQQNTGGAQDRIEAIAQTALERVNLMRHDAAPRYLVQVQVGAETMRNPYYRPRTRLVVGADGRLYEEWPLFPDLDTLWFRHSVKMVLRDSANGQAAYETTAVFDGPWSDTLNLLPAMLEAALQDYPQPMRRRVVVELPAPTGGNR